MPKLIVQMEGGDKVYALPNAPFTIGRTQECDLTIDHPKSSRQHAEIAPHEGGWRVTDLGSRNGTHVNEAKVDSHVLSPGDAIRVANVTMFFQRVPSATVEAKKCTNCFETIPANAAICPSCSEPQGEFDVTARCPGCGKELESAETFCTFCGANIDTGLAPSACPGCHKVVPRDAEVCPFCDLGFDVGTSRIASQPNPVDVVFKIAAVLELVVILVMVLMLAGRKSPPPRPKKRKAVEIRQAAQAANVDSFANELCSSLQEGDAVKLQPYWNASEPVNVGGLVAAWAGDNVAEAKITSCKLLKTTRNGEGATTDILVSLTCKDADGAAQQTTKVVLFAWQRENGKWAILTPQPPAKTEPKAAPPAADTAPVPPPESKAVKPQEPPAEPAQPKIEQAPVLPPPPKEDQW